MLMIGLTLWKDRDLNALRRKPEKALDVKPIGRNHSSLSFTRKMCVRVKCYSTITKKNIGTNNKV